MNYYKRHLGDYAKKTRTLTTYEHGVYNLLLDLYYSEEAPLSEEDAVAVCRAATKAERQSVAKVLERYFEKVDGRWHNSRADEEVAKYHEKATKNAAIGSLGGKQKAKRNASETLSESAGECLPNDNPSHKPVTNNQEEANPPTPRKRGADKFDPMSVILPDWLPAPAWREWVESRGRKKLSEIAVAKQLRDLGAWRAKGHDPVEVLGTSIRNGWQGLFEPKGKPVNGFHHETTPVDPELLGDLEREARKHTGAVQ